MMPLLVADENFPAPSVSRLRDRNYDVLSIRERHAGLADEKVLEIARAQGRWLLTFDRDYGELIFSRRVAHPPCIVLFRLRDYSLTEPAERILPLLSEAAGALTGYFVVVGSRATRKRPMLRVV